MPRLSKGGGLRERPDCIVYNGFNSQVCQIRQVYAEGDCVVIEI